ncbi:MAG: DNA repair protein RadC [Clostridiales bacterium]|nr:DNA repair protein RadC [Clostridiales bacterium]
MNVHDGHRQRVKKRFSQQGLDGFSDHEVLELLLFYAIPRRDTNELAHRLLERFGSLQAVLRAPFEELERFSGMGESAAILLKLTPAVIRRSRIATEEEIIFNSVEKTGAYFLRRFQGERREILYQACLDRKGKVINCKKLAEGSVNQATANIRSIVENALFTGASGVILAHNHPSGIALPSEADVSMTLAVRDALQTVGVELIDHIIAADNDFVSMAANGTLLSGGDYFSYPVF